MNMKASSRAHPRVGASVVFAVAVAVCAQEASESKDVTIYYQCDNMATLLVNGKQATVQRVKEFPNRSYLDVYRHVTPIRPGDTIGFVATDIRGGQHLTAVVVHQGKVLFGTNTATWYRATETPSESWWTRTFTAGERKVSARKESEAFQVFFSVVGLPPAKTQPVWGTGKVTYIKKVVTAADLRDA
jgi:hypothetical protein